MKLHFMKAIIYSVALTLLCIGFSACEKESDLIELENSEIFFEYQSKHEVHLSTVIEFLKEKNDSIPFTQEFKDLYGRAMWDENITVENSDGFVILVPVLSNDKANLNGIWMFNRYDNLMNYGVIPNDEEVRRNLQLDYTFAYFEQELLGLNEKYEFENLTTEDENSLTKGGYMVEYCYIIKTIMNGVEIINPNPYCTNIWVPSADTNKYFFQDWGDGGVGSGSDDGGGMGNPTPTPAPAPVPLPSPETPIESIEEYLDCIDRSLPATLTIYVDQALANTDNAYWGRTAGHCFVGITQNGNESIFGFHPKDGAKEEGPNTSILGDDSGRSYDVSITIEISADHVSQALYYVHNYPNVYDLSDFNCTDFAINMAAKGGITLPDTYKSWPSGGGSCPGQLGQDIRKMTLPAGVTPNYSGGDAPNNIKTCK